LGKEKLSGWIQIVGLFAVFASMLFVGYEIRQSGQVAKEESLLSEQANVISIETLVVENADVWLRGCMGEELKPSDHMIFTHIYHTYISRHFFQWLRTREGISVASDSLAIDNMAKNLYRSAGLLREWQSHGEWRKHVPNDAIFQVWRGLVEDRLEEIPTIEPTPIANPSRCGLN